jgi:hypothetical protein
LIPHVLVYVHTHTHIQQNFANSDLMWGKIV